MINKTELEIVKTWIGDDKKPLVSVCALSYNHEKYIEEALDSFLMQKTSFPFEIIIHDDASTDMTQIIIQKYKEKFPNIIKIIFQTENQYSKGNRPSLLVLKEARGEFIALCETDDYWCDPYKLEKQVSLLNEYPNINISFHSSIRHNILENTKYITGDILRVIESMGANVFNDKNNENITYGYVKNKEFNNSYCVIAPLENIILKTFYGYIENSSCLLRSSMIGKLLRLFKEHPYLPFGDFYIQILSSYPNGALFVNNIMSVYRLNSNTTSYTWQLQDEEKETLHYNRFLPTIRLLDQMTEYEFTDSFNVFFHKRMYRVYCESLNGCIWYNDYRVIFKKIINQLKYTEQDYILFGYGVFGKSIYEELELKTKFVIDKYLRPELFSAPEKVLDISCNSDIYKLVNAKEQIIISPIANTEEVIVALKKLGVPESRIVNLLNFLPNYLTILNK